MVPNRLASTAVTNATVRLVVSASIANGLRSALPYHLTEKPRKSLAWRPALKLNSTMIPIGM